MVSPSRASNRATKASFWAFGPGQIRKVLKETLLADGELPKPRAAALAAVKHWTYEVPPERAAAPRDCPQPRQQAEERDPDESDLRHEAHH